MGGEGGIEANIKMPKMLTQANRTCKYGLLSLPTYECLRRSQRRILSGGGGGEGLFPNGGAAHHRIISPGIGKHSKVSFESEYLSGWKAVFKTALEYRPGHYASSFDDKT